MSSAGENRQRFCESRREEEDGDNADVDEDDEDDEEVNMAIRNEIKRRAEKLLNMHQKVEDGKNAQALWCTGKKHVFPFLLHFFSRKFYGKSQKSIIVHRNAIRPWIAFLRRQVA